MKADKYAATEVPAAITVEECWDLVNTSEKTGKPCMMLENVCYFRNVLMVLNLIQKGMLGEIIHSEAGYQHDVRGGKIRATDGEIRWRGMHAVKRNANLYPTHPIGPVAWWSSINRIGLSWTLKCLQWMEFRRRGPFMQKTPGAVC